MACSESCTKKATHGGKLFDLILLQKQSDAPAACLAARQHLRHAHRYHQDWRLGRISAHSRPKRGMQQPVR
eukprot:2073641-Pleurochrysis_carterae.AAC.1